jgi:hypothetical protein
MSKFKIKQEEEQLELPIGNNPVNQEVVIKVTEPNYTRFLLGSYIDPQNGEWMLAQVPFDPLTKMTGKVVVSRVGGDVQVLRERLMVKQVNLGLLEAGTFKEERVVDLY